MQATIISITRTTSTTEHATNPEQSGTDRRYVAHISLTDMPNLPTNRYYRGTAPGWMPTYVKVSETLQTGFGDDNPSHWRVVSAKGFMLKKDGTVGKLATGDIWRIYATHSDSMPPELAEAIAQVVPAFRKGTLPA